MSVVVGRLRLLGIFHLSSAFRRNWRRLSSGHGVRIRVLVHNRRRGWGILLRRRHRWLYRPRGDSTRRRACRLPETFRHGSWRGLRRFSGGRNMGLGWWACCRQGRYRGCRGYSRFSARAGRNPRRFRNERRRHGFWPLGRWRINLPRLHPFRAVLFPGGFCLLRTFAPAPIPTAFLFLQPFSPADRRGLASLHL